MLTDKSNRYFAGLSASFVHRNSFGGELNDAAHKDAIARKKLDCCISGRTIADVAIGICSPIHSTGWTTAYAISHKKRRMLKATELLRES
ncbi:MAG: hypothetical protein WBA41_28945 [Rivularia sp. (in: cyanobacteria)]